MRTKTSRRPVARPLRGSGNSAVKISAGYGRLYVSGPAHRVAHRLPGATLNDRRSSVEVSLTLETLRSLRKMLGASQEEFVRFCTPDVLAWAKAAGKSERHVNELHQKLEHGWLLDLPWEDLNDPPRKPFAHQEVMATVSCIFDGSAYVCDMGCVDAETEYLSPTGWKKIGEYSGGEVAQYHPDTEKIEFVLPEEYVKLPCPEMIHFTSARGVDQMLSSEHRVLLRDANNNWKVVEASALEREVLEGGSMRKWKLPTTFTHPDRIGIPLTDAQLRLQVAVMADGHFPSDVHSGTRCTVRLKRERKIERLRTLLEDAGIEAYERPVKPEGFVGFSFPAPLRIKSYDEQFWQATPDQCALIADECWRWDGAQRKAGAVEFFTTDKASADFVQYCLAGTGWCASLNTHRNPDHVVHASPKRLLKQLGNGRQNVSRVSSHDGYKYCFRVPTTFLIFRRNGCVFPSGNTGKTRAAIESIKYKLVEDELDVVVVLCPKGVMNTWAREMRQWVGPPSILLAGPVKERAAYIRDWQPVPLGARVLILNYDVLYLLEDDLRDLAGRFRVGICLDEMHRGRNPQAKVTKASMKLAQHANWRLGMTGTPVLQGLQDVWSQWYVVDLGISLGSNFVQYKREFLDEDPYTMKLIAKPGMLEEVGIRMRKRGLRYTKEDCLDLPPKVYETLEVEMGGEQTRAYNQMKNDLIATLQQMEAGEDSFATAANQLALILRLTQITSGFVKREDGEIHRFNPNPKLVALKEIVEENLSHQQMIVWARYREDIRAAAEALAVHDPVIIQGGQNAAERLAAENRFQDGDARLLLANPGAGGVGLNLQAASLAVYYSQGYSLEHRLQSEDRCHRSGSEVHNKVTYIDLIVPDTIDEIITSALGGKKSIADAVVDLRHSLGME